MDKKTISSGKLAACITKTASKQTYYTIRLLVDRGRLEDAYRAYAYFRWVDDMIDDPSCSYEQRIHFTNRQKSLLEACYRGQVGQDLCAEEKMLADLVQNDTEKNSGLQIYLRNMMDVMVFDAWRRGRIISQCELSDYSHKLGKAVTEALYYFIGHDDPSPCQEARYLAVTAAHITHMLRDAVEDVDNGYYNIPGEIVSVRGISPRDLSHPLYREWVCDRVHLARQDFKKGRACTSRVKNLRCRLAGFAYISRFEWMLDAIERNQYHLRSDYPERKSLKTGLWMIRSTLTSMFASLRTRVESQESVTQSMWMDER
ncbi:MAG: phytoene/squalene synthase family protein [Bacteroidota bacterium]